MSDHSEIKLLRDKIARAKAEVKKKGVAIEQRRIQIEQMNIQIEQQNTQIEQKRIQIEQKRIQIEQLKRQLDKRGGRIAHYENLHRLPSANSMPARWRKRFSRSDPAEYEKPGQRPGHKVFSHGRGPSLTIHHMPEACATCGCRDLDPGRIVDVVQVTDIPPEPKAETVSHGARRHVRKVRQRHGDGPVDV